MDELANSIGWTVMISLAIFVVGKIIIAQGKARDEQKHLLMNTWDIERQLAFRRLWFSTTDLGVRSEIKSQYGPWALLQLDLNDQEFSTNLLSGSLARAYQEAVRNIQAKGYAYELREGKIVATFSSSDEG